MIYLELVKRGFSCIFNGCVEVLKGLLLVFFVLIALFIIGIGYVLVLIFDLIKNTINIEKIEFNLIKL